MCQGVIVSLVEFKGKQVILSGIGSHSKLLKDNKQLLIDRGWAEDNESQKVFSIESDFTNGYGKFTIESGKPDDKQLELLTREYLNCAGTDRQLIDHVKRCGKIDGSLVKLLTPEANGRYYEARALIGKQYKEACAPIWKQYSEACAPILKQREEACATIWKQYDKDVAPIWKQYEEAFASIRKQYDEAHAPIQKQYDKDVAPIRKQYQEDVAPIWKQYKEAIFPIWISLFENPENRIDVMK